MQRALELHGGGTPTEKCTGIAHPTPESAHCLRAGTLAYRKIPKDEEEQIIADSTYTAFFLRC